MKMRNINLALFSLMLVTFISLPILCVDRYMSHPDMPWQLVPFGADSLSQTYKNQYLILGPQALMTHLADSVKPTAMVLVDGWGVPYEEKMLKEDFKILDSTKVIFAIHKRLLGYTTHAENVEYKNAFLDGALIASSDSISCANTKRGLGTYFKQTICCSKCNDDQSLSLFDSLLTNSEWDKIAWTALGNREGDRKKLHSLLRRLVNIANKHPNVQFIIQGTHRPTLGSPETRRKHLAPWVPAVFINCELKK